MSSLGQYLSGLRQERGLSIDEMARSTRVAARYLEALESDDFGALPAPVFTKGYIRAYCQAVGVAASEALTRYAGSVASVAVANPPTVAPRSAQTTDNSRRARGTLLVSFVLLVGFGLALFVVALFLQSGRPETGARRSEPPSAAAPRPTTPAAAGAREAASIPPPAATAPTPAAPTPAASPADRPAPAASTAPPVAPAPTSQPADAKPANATDARPMSGTPRLAVDTPRQATDALRGGAEPTRPPTESRPTAETPRPAADASRAPTDASRPSPAAAEVPPLKLAGVVSPYRLVVRASETTWLRVRTEDGRSTEETLPAGAVREWVSNRPFVLTVGNAGGATFELNGRKLPPLGSRGGVINRLVLPPSEP
jgi:cytoskeletal protein RodZ